MKEESTFAARQEDAAMTQVSNADLCCGRCIHCREDRVDRCDRYIRKPGAVFYGGSCPQFEEQK